MTKQEFIEWVRWQDSKKTLKSNELLAKLDAVIQSEIEAHEAEQWKPFPKFVPGCGNGGYLCQISGGDMKVKDGTPSTDWTKVIAFRELPSPYKP